MQVVVVILDSGGDTEGEVKALCLRDGLGGGWGVGSSLEPGEEGREKKSKEKRIMLI